MRIRTALFVFVVGVALVAGFLWARRQIQVDTCLDSGGRFDNESGRCDPG
jgi:hypothetical protein